MKKTLALILAAMMVAGTASVAFAAGAPDIYVYSDGATDENGRTPVATESHLYKWDEDSSVYVKISNGATVEYGDRVAVELQGRYNDDKDEVKKVKAYPDWKVGSSLVESAEIKYVKTEDAGSYVAHKLSKTTKKYTLKDLDGSTEYTLPVGSIVTDKEYASEEEAMTALRSLIRAQLVDSSNASASAAWADDTKVSSAARAEFAEKVFADIYSTEKVSADRSYKYLVVIDLKESTSTKTQDLAGYVRVGKTTTAAKNNKDDGYYYDLDLEVKNAKSDEKIGDDVDTITVNLDKYTTNFVLDVADDADVTDIEFGSDGDLALFTVDLDGQPNINVGYSTKFNADIADKYPSANLNFIKWTATPTFNRTGDLYIYADEDTFIYEVTADGLKEIAKAEYDEDYGAWHIRTRKLSSYVVSDEELDVTASTSSSEASSSETSSSNPSTGGTTGTGSNTNVKPNPNTGR